MSTLLSTLIFLHLTLLCHCLYHGPLFQCSGPGSKLLPLHVQCDGYPDCPGGEDEAACGGQQRNYNSAPPQPQNNGYYFPQPQVNLLKYQNERI